MVPETGVLAYPQEVSGWDMDCLEQPEVLDWVPELKSPLTLSVRSRLLGTIGTWRWLTVGAPRRYTPIWSARSSRGDSSSTGVSIGSSRGRTSVTTARGESTPILGPTMGRSRVVAPRGGSRCLSCSSWATLWEEQA